MLVDSALLTKEEIQNEAGERTTLALVIGEGESKRQHTEGPVVGHGLIP